MAQIQWLNRAHLGEAVDVSHAKPPLLYEANAWASYYKGNFELALQESLKWLADQPFSGAPAILASFILSDLLWNFEGGREIAQSALRSNPDDPMLLNNLAVCLMELDRLTEAEEILARIKPGDRANKSEKILEQRSACWNFERATQIKAVSST